MALYDTAFEQITEADLMELVSAQIPEGLHLEFKLELPGNSESDKREFLSDVSAFANGPGGDIVYGMREDQGKAAELVGLTIDPDKELLRLTSIARTGLDPRLPSFEARSIALVNGAHAVTIRIRRSWLLPHMVVAQGVSRFFSRGPVGKHQLDVTELRSLFRLGADTERQVREFRASRLGSIAAGETPVVLKANSQLVLHLLPLAAFGITQRYNYRDFEKHVVNMRPLYASGWDWRHNLDGFMASSSRVEDSASSYVQFLRNGAVEAVETGMLRPDSHGSYIPSVVFEREILGGIPRYLALQRAMGVPMPIVAMLTLLNVKDFYMAVNPALFFHVDKRVIDRRDVLAPEVLIEDYDTPIATIVKDLVDPIWNAAGWPQSANFSADGTWKPR